MPLYVKDFKISSYQTTLFTPFCEFVQNRILAGLLNSFSDVFDGETTSIPLPDDAPPEIPRIILSSTDGKQKIECSKLRINIFLFPDEGLNNKSISNFLDLCLNLFKSYIEISNSKVGRLATVVKKYKKDQNPAKTLSDYFCKDEFIAEPLKRPEKFEMHAHKRYSFDDFDVNSWIRFKTGIFTPTNENIILIEQDINTLAEQINEKDYSLSQIKTFLVHSEKEQKEILLKYLLGNE